MSNSTHFFFFVPLKLAKENTAQQHLCHQPKSRSLYASNSPPWYLCMYYTLSGETEPSEYTTHQLSIHRVYTKYRQSIHCFSTEYIVVWTLVPSQNHQTVLNNMLMRSPRKPGVYGYGKISERNTFLGGSLLWKPWAGFKALQDCWDPYFSAGKLKMAPELF